MIHKLCAERKKIYLHNAPAVERTPLLADDRRHTFSFFAGFVPKTEREFFGGVVEKKKKKKIGLAFRRPPPPTRSHPSSFFSPSAKSSKKKEKKRNPLLPKSLVPGA